MPPKKKVLTDDELKTQFEDWKLSDEYKCMEQCRLRLQELELPISFSETTRDITGNWQRVLDELYNLFVMNKVRNPKIKKFEHEHIRTIFFAKFDDDGIVHHVDGIRSGVGKPAGQRADNMRKPFIGVYKKLIELPECDHTTYVQMKKDLVTFMKEFMKPIFFPTHVKSQEGHVQILEQMLDVLTPLRLLIEKNMDYRLFNLKYKSEMEREIQSFQLREIEKKYTDFLQEVLRIIVKEFVPDDPKNPVPPPINFMPRIEQIFYKLHYQYNNNNLIEKFYLDQLHIRFDSLQKELCTLEYKGWLYWKTPMVANDRLVKCIKDLVKSEVICKDLMGNELSRDQINFIFQIMKHLKDSDPKVEENILKEDENALNRASPLLIIFKLMQHMRKWKDTQVEQEKKLQIEREKMGIVNRLKEAEESQFPLKQIQLNRSNSSAVMSGIASGSPLKHQPTFILSSTLSPDQKTNQKSMSTTKFFTEGGFRIPGKQLDSEEEKYGRYFILEGYMDEEHQRLMEDGIELLRNINMAVQQDIQDFYIKEGIIPMKKKTTDPKEAQTWKEMITNATKYMDSKGLEENANEGEKMVRPPELWNYPQIVKETHQFRSIADPKQCYIDGRFENFNAIVEECAKHLLNYNTIRWHRLIKRIIDCFKGFYKEEPEQELILQEIQNFG